MKTISALIAFFVGAFAILSITKPAALTAGRPPTNAATVYFHGFFREVARQLSIGFIKFKIAIDDLFGFRSPILGVGVAANLDEQILKSLTELGEKHKSFEEALKDIKLIKETEKERTAQLTDMQRKILDFQKFQIERTGNNDRRSYDGMSDSCARYLGGVYLLASLKQDKEGRIKSSMREVYEREIKSILGIEAKASVSTSDIPLPTAYSGDIVELVYQYGTARRFGTVIPLGAGTFKLPKLGTDPVFTLNLISAAVSEKNPTSSFVTFTAEKFGGLIRMPTEIDEDSIIQIGQFIGRYVARNMALCEDWQFWRSTGAASAQNGTAEGLTKSVVTDADFVYNGGSSTSGKTKQSDATLADFRALRAAASGAVLGNAAYFVHPTYEQLFASFNTSATVMPYLAAGANGPTLDGFPIRWIPSLPAYSTGASVSLVHVLFGDARFNYLGVRGGPRIDTSTDAGFTTDEVLTRALERMTVGKMATTAVVGLRNSAS